MVLICNYYSQYTSQKTVIGKGIRKCTTKIIDTKTVLQWKYHYSYSIIRSSSFVLTPGSHFCLIS